MAILIGETIAVFDTPHPPLAPLHGIVHRQAFSGKPAACFLFHTLVYVLFPLIIKCFLVEVLNYLGVFLINLFSESAILAADTINYLISSGDKRGQLGLALIAHDTDSGNASDCGKTNTCGRNITGSHCLYFLQCRKFFAFLFLSLFFSFDRLRGCLCGKNCRADYSGTGHTCKNPRSGLLKPR